MDFIWIDHEIFSGLIRKDDTARTFEFLFRFNRVWINSRLLLLLLSKIYLYLFLIDLFLIDLFLIHLRFIYYL